MKRKLVTAVVAVSVLLGGGAALAFADGDTSTAGAAEAQAPAAEARTAARAADTNTSTTDSTTDSRTDSKTGVTEAIAAALAHTPGTAVSADREDDGQGAGTWQVDVVKADGAEYVVTVSPDTGKVLGAHRDTDDDGDDDGRADLAALKGTTVDAREAVRAVAAKGTVTDVDLDGDAGAVVWGVDTARGGEWLVDARTGKVTQDLDD
ncbi:PepSY domain-containing protein [Streptomyces sp. NPDC054884]|uniref:PepSY domain-containing protein n=1 Tax=Streptomyces sp. ME08-AFT2 TaxID=3028683 RepID=UPI0029B51309|nr:PepSY domain-containing protein [Streptomyces sp. ME08-AFT2]MDX3314954.1 PepSY domain-containing protein [Streptomyces sp. ME08-AFT2]